MRSSLGNHLIVNERAPVRAYLKDHEERTRDFPNLAAFKAWYVPKYHVLVPTPNTQYLFTDVLLECIDDPPRRGAARSPRTPGAPRAAGPRRSSVDVDGAPHASVYQAFVALGLPVPAHGKFRAELKRAGEKTFAYAGREYKFKVIG